MRIVALGEVAWPNASMEEVDGCMFGWRNVRPAIPLQKMLIYVLAWGFVYGTWCLSVQLRDC